MAGPGWDAALSRGMDYPGIGGTRNGEAPEGYARVLEEIHLGSGLPLYRLLGGTRREQLPAYASLIRYADREAIAANTQRAIVDGYRSVKLHEVDLAVIRAARAAAGPDIEITLDVNCPWSLAEAIDMARALAPLSLRWLEEPLWPPEKKT